MPFLFKNLIKIIKSIDSKPYRINLNELEDKTLDFDKIINNYSCYNCNSELGKSIAYYIKDLAQVVGFSLNKITLSF